MLYDQSADKHLIHSDNDGELLRVVSFDDDGDTGPSIGIKRNSDSPANDDDAILKIEKDAQAVFQNTLAAREGLEILLPA